MSGYYYGGSNDPRNQNIPMNANPSSREASTNIAHGGSYVPGRNRTANGSQSIAHGGSHHDIPGGNRPASGSQNIMHGAGYIPDGSRPASGSQSFVQHILGGTHTAGAHGGNYVPGGSRTANGSQPSIGYQQGTGVVTTQQHLPNNPPRTYQATGPYGSSYAPSPTGQRVGAHGGSYVPGSRSSSSQQQSSQASSTMPAQGSVPQSGAYYNSGWSRGSLTDRYDENF